ncbi:MAG: ATP-binding cassette domain-containing protein [Gammaproteobacteria bacterium]|nr:ATP-binding cassette domain-containing protein [Gammaproteobacteria bacterium]
MTTPLLQLSQVEFTSSLRDKPLIDNVCCQLLPGDFVILLGSNGSGKSTLIKLINKSYRLNRGLIEFNGENISRIDRRVFARAVVTLTQSTEASLFNQMTIAENGLLWEMRMCGLPLKSTKRARIAELHSYLEQFHERLAERMNVPVNRLSGGERQILILALCLRYQLQLLLLDEHTSALDPKTAERMMERTYAEVTKRHVSCIMTTHNLDFALRYGNRLLAIHDGEIIHDLSAEEKSKMSRQQLLEDCYL